MVFWIFVIGGLIGLLLAFLNDNFIEFGAGIFAIGLMGVVTCGIVIGINHVSVEADIAKLNTRYETLVYQYENDFYENDNDVGKRDLIKDIQEWNENLAYKQDIQRNLWIGIFVPDIYDQFEFIELR